MLRLVLRPMLVILTLGMLLLAVFQVAGRISLALLDDLEPSANQALSARGVRLHGLSGDWRMLNPVIHVDRIDLPAGFVRGVVLEVDTIESVLRGTLLARRLKVDEARIDLEKRPGEPWRLAGAVRPASLDVDLQPFLRHSNQLELNGVLRFLRHGHPPAEVAVDYLGINRGGEHRHRLQVANQEADCPDGCRLTVELHGQERLWPLRDARATFTVDSSGFMVPRAILGFSPVEIAQLDVAWQQVDDASGGTLELRTEQFDLPGDMTLATRLSGTLRGRGGEHRGRIGTWRVEQGDSVWELPPVSVRAAGQRVFAWMPELDLGRAAGFLRHALGAVEPAERWIGALNLRGRAHNLRASYGLDGAGLVYSMTLADVALDGYKGVPTVVGAGGELFGFGRGLQLNLNAQGLEIAFPDIFTGQWQLPYAQGVVQAWFSPGYFGVRGINMRAETLGSRAAGGFAMSRPPEREGQRLLLLISTDRMDVAAAQQFVPYKLPVGLRDWLTNAPQGGVLEDARVAYQGQFKEEPGELARRLALTSHIRGGQLRYHESWPAVTGVAGQVDVAGSLVSAVLDEGMSAGATLGGSRVRVLDNGATVDLSLDAQAQADDVLDFVRTTPLTEWLAFVGPQWAAEGPMRLSGEITVPLGDNADEPEVRLRADLESVDLSLPEYRVDVAALEGSVRYRYPYQVDASAVRGRLFGEPITASAYTDSGRGTVHIGLAGRARPADAWRLADVADPGVAEGAFAYEADLGIAVTPEGVTSLTASSDLVGATVDLPAGYGKAADATAPGRVEVEFGDDFQTLRFAYRDAQAWLHVGDTLLRGGLGLGGALPVEHEDAANLLVTGKLAGFALEEVLPPDDAEGSLPLPIYLDDLQVDRIGVGDFTVNAATLNGGIDSLGFDLQVDSDEVKGALVQQGDAPLALDFEEVNVPVGEGEEGDPITPDLIAELPRADVKIDRLRLGGDDYGAWQFALHPQPQRLAVEELRARVRGMEIEATEPLLWDGRTGETRFAGRLTGTDLAEVLPQWGYAPSVETESVSLIATLAWNGSPLAVDLLALRGDVVARASNGRFLDVESGAGAQRIFSLLNFTTIAKRMSLNFGDVFGRGISFDSLNADFTLDEGLLAFQEPMEVRGTGSRFKVTGTVDIEHQRLDNEMIVTLPVSQSLPWYAAYVALANPLAGLGVLVGERVLRKPIEQFSSARYHIGGTLDDPDVKFVSVFDVSTPAASQDGAAEGQNGAATAQDGAAASENSAAASENSVAASENSAAAAQDSATAQNGAAASRKGAAASRKRDAGAPAGDDGGSTPKPRDEAPPPEQESEDS